MQQVHENVVRGMKISSAEAADSTSSQMPTKPITDGSTISICLLPLQVFFSGGIFTLRLPCTWTIYVCGVCVVNMVVT